MSLTQAQLKELLLYDLETGIFTRAKNVGSRWRTGDVVGSWDMHGYKTVRIGSSSYKLHRLAWLYVNGVWPEGDIDHMNGDRADNRFCNLRDVPRQMNLQNCRKAASHNQSTKVLGVYPSRNGRFLAAISVNNRKRHLGTYDSVEEAHEAYLAAKRKLHEGCTI